MPQTDIEAQTYHPFNSVYLYSNAPVSLEDRYNIAIVQLEDRYSVVT